MDRVSEPVGVRPSAPTLAFVAVSCLFALRLAFVAMILPPWQNPDEPAHFAVIRSLALQTSIDLSRRGDPEVQAEILASMAEHGWWEAYGERRPNPVPARFADASLTHLGDESRGPFLFYLLASLYCRVIGTETLVGQYYAVRVLSLFTTLLTLGIIIRAAQESFGTDVALCTGGLVALVPQFALIGVSIGPDPLVFLAGAFVWWQAVRIAAHKGLVLPAVGMVAATLAGVLSKQLAFPLIAQATLLAFIAVAATARTRRGRMLGLLTMVAFVLLGVLVVAMIVAQPGSTLLHRYVGWLGWQGRPFVLDYLSRFTWALLSSAFLAVGWLRFFPPSSLVVVALALCVFGLVRGAVSSLLGPDNRVRLGACLAAVFVAVQLWSTYGTWFYHEGAQGRFLFPCIGPFAALCAFGLVRWNSSRTRAVAACVVVGLMAVLDVVGWTTTMIAAYAR